MAPLGQRIASILDVERWVAAGRLWAILDATDTPSVPAMVEQLGPDRAVSLYRGGAEENLAAIAPYLVRVDHPVYRWITESLWADPWGIFALASATLEELRLHFRRFLIVESPGGESWYFRFYDPRVLPKFLTASTDQERSDFFGPVRAFGVTDEESYGIRIITPEAAPSAWFSQTQPVIVKRAAS